MKNRIAKYTIDKSVSDWTNDNGIPLDDKNRQIFFEEGFIKNFESEEKAIEEIKKIYGLECNFESWFKEFGDEKGRWFGSRIEGEDGYENENGEYLADYNIYLTIYEEIEL